MALEKIRIPRRIAAFVKDVVADVIIKQINKRKPSEEKDSQAVNFSTIEFEREMRSRVEELEKQMINMEAVITQGKLLYESVIKSLPGASDPTIQIEGDVTINVYIINCPEGAQIVGKDFVITPKRITELVNCEAENRFIIDDETDTGYIIDESDNTKEGPINAQGTYGLNKDELIEKFYAKVKELRRL